MLDSSFFSPRYCQLSPSLILVVNKIKNNNKQIQKEYNRTRLLRDKILWTFFFYRHSFKNETCCPTTHQPSILRSLHICCTLTQGQGTALISKENPGFPHIKFTILPESKVPATDGQRCPSFQRGTSWEHLQGQHRT